MHNQKTKTTTYDHSEWPRDYNFLSAVAEQQEMITQPPHDAELMKSSHNKTNNATNDSMWPTKGTDKHD